LLHLERRHLGAAPLEAQGLLAQRRVRLLKLMLLELLLVLVLLPKQLRRPCRRRRRLWLRERLQRWEPSHWAARAAATLGLQSCIEACHADVIGASHWDA
jgi:hypothetical protein